MEGGALALPHNFVRGKGIILPPQILQQYNVKIFESS